MSSAKRAWLHGAVCLGVLAPAGAAQSARTSFPGRNGPIVFASNRARGGLDIFVMRADGTHQRDLTKTRGTEEIAPAWSPDGTRIAFAQLGNPGHLVVMRADGTSTR